MSQRRDGAKWFLLWALLALWWAALHPGAGLASTATPAADQQHVDLVLDEARGLVYGAATDLARVDVFDASSLALIATIGLPGSPYGMDMSADHGTLAVAVLDGDAVALIDLATRTVTGAIASPGPVDVRFGRPGRLLVVGRTEPRYLRVYDTATGQLVGQAAQVLRDWPGLALTADGNTAFVACTDESDAKLYRYDVSGDTPQFVAEAPDPLFTGELDIAPDGSRVYTSRGQIWKGDLSGLLGTMSNTSGDSIAYAPARERVYITNDFVLFTMDALTFARLGMDTSADGEGVVRVDAAGDRLFMGVAGYGLRSLVINPGLTQYVPVVMSDVNNCADYEDDFEDPASGWPVGSTSNLSLAYLAGEYQVLSHQESTIFLVAAPTCRRERYRVEVTGRWGGATGAGYGLLFGVTPDGEQYYTFEVDPLKQEYRITRFFPGGYGEAGTYHAAIQPGTAANRLQIIVGDDLFGERRLQFAINGTVVGSRLYEGPEEPAGVGVMSRSAPFEPTSDARFDAFEVATWKTILPPLTPVDEGSSTPVTGHWTSTGWSMAGELGWRSVSSGASFALVAPPPSP